MCGYAARWVGWAYHYSSNRKARAERGPSWFFLHCFNDDRFLELIPNRRVEKCIFQDFRSCYDCGAGDTVPHYAEKSHFAPFDRKHGTGCWTLDPGQGDRGED